MVATRRDEERVSPSAASVRISGVGVEVPSNVVTTLDVERRAALVERFGVERGWLEQVTGVRERRWADPDDQPSQFAALAGWKALADAGADPLSIDTLIYTGITRDCLEPATANLVADALGARGARVFDVTNACNSLIDGIDIADALIRAGKARRVLVTSGEHASTTINWRAHSIQEMLQSVTGFVIGDGGGAVVVEASDDPQRGVRQREFRSDPTHWRHAVAGRFRSPTQACTTCGGTLDYHFRCSAREVFAAAFRLLSSAMEAVLERTGWSWDELDVVFCHQPSKRFIDNGIEQLGEPARRILREKLWSTAERFGNMSTCSLPLAMAEARAAGALVPGKKALLLTAASGVSAAAMTVIW
jgi:3-oxoacyl-(acyl-carrier-protein) synthase III